MVPLPGPAIRLGTWLIKSHRDVSRIKYATYAEPNEQWDELIKGASITSEELLAFMQDPKQAEDLLLSMVVVMTRQDDLRSSCSHTWYRTSADAVHFWKGDVMHMYFESLRLAKQELDVVIDDMVTTIGQVADFVTSAILRQTCEFLVVLVEGSSQEMQRTVCNKHTRQLLAVIDALEMPFGEGSAELLAELGMEPEVVDRSLFHWREQPPRAPAQGTQGHLPTLVAMRRLISASDDARGRARNIVGFTMVLQKAVLAAVGSNSPGVKAFLADLRDKSWRCGTKTSESTLCKVEKLAVPVPADDLDSSMSGAVSRIFGSRFVTALLLFWPDEEAYDRRGGQNGPVGFPGGLGSEAGAPAETSGLKERLWYWDPAVNVLEWVEEMCEHHRVTTGARNCYEYRNWIIDFSAWANLGASFTAGATFIGNSVSIGGAAAVSGASLPGLLSGAVMSMPHHGGPLLTGVASIFGATVAPPVLAALTIGGLVSSTHWVVTRMAGMDAENLADEDCMCGILSTVNRPALRDGSPVFGEFIPHRETIGLGYDFCSKGLGECRTDRVMDARKAIDVGVGSLAALLGQSGCKDDAGCVEKANAAWCDWTEVVRSTKEECTQNEHCDGTIPMPTPKNPERTADARPLFKKVCHDFNRLRKDLKKKARKAFKEADLGFPPEC